MDQDGRTATHGEFSMVVVVAAPMCEEKMIFRRAWSRVAMPLARQRRKKRPSLRSPLVGQAFIQCFPLWSSLFGSSCTSRLQQRAIWRFCVRCDRQQTDAREDYRHGPSCTAAHCTCRLWSGAMLSGPKSHWPSRHSTRRPATFNARLRRPVTCPMRPYCCCCPSGHCPIRPRRSRSYIERPRPRHRGHCTGPCGRIDNWCPIASATATAAMYDFCHCRRRRESHHADRSSSHVCPVHVV
jgi:hypothetical protein